MPRSTLLTTINASGDTAAIPFNGASGNGRSLSFTGNFNSQIITIKASLDGTNFITLTGPDEAPVEITQASIIRINIGSCDLKFNSSGAGTDVNVHVS